MFVGVVCLHDDAGEASARCGDDDRGAACLRREDSEGKHIVHRAPLYKKVHGKDPFDSVDRISHIHSVPTYPYLRREGSEAQAKHNLP